MEYRMHSFVCVATSCSPFLYTYLMEIARLLTVFDSIILLWYWVTVGKCAQFTHAYKLFAIRAIVVRSRFKEIQNYLISPSTYRWHISLNSHFVRNYFKLSRTIDWYCINSKEFNNEEQLRWCQSRRTSTERWANISCVEFLHINDFL